MALTAEQYLAGYETSVALVRRRVLAFVRQTWAGSPSYRERDVDRIVAAIVPRLQAGQVRVAQLTAAYIASVARLEGRDVAALPVVREQVTDRRGVPAPIVYRRPAKTVYKALADGKPFETAAELGAQRLEHLVNMDLQLAKVAQAQSSYTASGAKFYRRVLTGNENCGLCMIASTQRYRVGTLMPIHPGCDCNSEEVTDGAPDQVLDPDLLQQTHDWVARFTGDSDRGGRAPDYRKLIVTREHGEYGPTLAWRGDRFTGPRDV